jgi:inosine triphosphate pyrophosphatase
VIYFITGNKNKFTEAKGILPLLEQLDLDLPEIQEIDPKKIIEAKLQEALRHKTADFVVEDTSLSLDCLNGLPGPLIKWFLKAVGNEGLTAFADKFENASAEARTMIGYATSSGDIHYFEGVIKGRIVPSRGETSFGWDPVFMPEGFEKTFAEMSSEEKNSISMRRIAFQKLKEFIG